jgi:Raf kinase inhibitor-like YbhB/YbcL family protein
MPSIRVALILLAASAVAGSLQRASAGTRGVEKPLTVTSSAFRANGPIPRELTCRGGDKSPPLSWSPVPGETMSIAILIEDPDAPKGPFTHWIVTDLPRDTTSLPEGGGLPPGAIAGSNSTGTTGYVGPCPPSGTHH